MSKLPPLTAAFDRGPTRYFHGRETIRRSFKNLLDRAHASKTGTTFLIHGAPGAGKSALLHECEKIAEAAEWQAAIIDPPNLWEVDSLRESLGLRKKFSFRAGEAGFSIFGFASAKVSTDKSMQTVKRLLQKGEKPLLLILDEAQRLIDISTPGTPQKIIASTILNAIHNGQLNKPVVFLAAGLNPTLKAFETFGISRFAKDCLVKLGALNKESERLVIRDWLTKEGGCKGDPTVWVDAITQETHGWPQHIQCYAGLASEYLQANGGVTTPDGLTSVLEAGHEDRIEYYKGRLVDFYADQIQCLVNSLPDHPSEKPTPRTEILSALTKKYGDAEAKDLFKRFIEKGIIEEHGMGFVVPIPSMHTWLKDTHGVQKIEMPPKQQKIRLEGGRDSGFER